MDKIIRLGFVVRGILYLLIGLFGLQFAVGIQSAPAETSAAIHWIGSLPAGRVALGVMALGFAGYAWWGIVRTFSQKTKINFSVRLGYLASALWYFALVFFTLRLLLTGSEMTSSHFVAGPLLKLLLSFAGLGVAVAGLSQMYYGLTHKFLGNKPMEVLAKFGYLARGVVFCVTGILVFSTSYVVSTPQVLQVLQGLGGGSILVATVSLGLVALGLYSIISPFIYKNNYTQSSRSQ